MANDRRIVTVEYFESEGLNHKQDYFADVAADATTGNRELSIKDANNNVVGQIIAQKEDSVLFKNVATPSEATDGANKGYADNNFANALKGRASGASVRLGDVSPTEHTLGVKAKSKNLFDISSSVGFQSYYSGVTSTISGTTITVVSTANRSCSLLLGDLSAGTYTISFSNTDLSLLMLQYGEALGQLSRLDNVNFVSSKLHTFTLTQPRKLWLESTIEANQTRTITDIQLEPGTTATAYTPYISDLSTVTVTRCGKNLFDINNPTYAALSKANTAFLPTIKDGVISFNTYYAQRGGSGFVIPVEPNTTITISFDSVGSDYWTEIMAVESILDNVAINIYKYPQFKNITKYTLTQRADKHYILFILDGVNGYYTAKIKNLQIEFGSTATPYEPYQGQTYTPTATGEVVGVTSLYPTTTLMTYTKGVIIEAEYNRDINKAFAEMQQAILSLGGNV